MNKSKFIAVTNQKGGVGKTTTTVNLGVAIARTGKRVLLIDADPQASLTASLNVRDPDQLNLTIASVMKTIIDDGTFPPDYGIIHNKEGVDLLPANIELSGMENLLVNTMSREFVLKEYLGQVRDRYDYVLIDCMPSLGMLTINALVAADSVLIPCQPNYLSMKGISLLLGSIMKIRRTINPKLQIEGILMTMVDSGRIPHALMFHEDEGSGAFAMAQAFLGYLFSTLLCLLVFGPDNFLIPALLLITLILTLLRSREEARA